MSTGYGAGMRDYRVTIKNKVVANGFGDTTGYVEVATVHAAMTFNKGVKSLREGALDAYDTVMFRMNWNSIVTRDSRLVCEGKEYQIKSLNGNKREKQMQITAVEVVKEDTSPYTPSSSAIVGGVRNPSEFGG